MPLTSENAEARLFDHLHSLKSERTRWHAALLKASPMDEPLRNKLGMQETQRALSAVARDAGIAAYICHDMDIVLLFTGSQDAYKEDLRLILRELSPFFDADTADISKIFIFSELARDYHSFKKWAEEKLQARMLAVGEEKYKFYLTPHYLWNKQQFAEAAQKRQNRKKPLIALIEDNFALRELTRNLLLPHYEVALAHDGFEALQLYNLHAPDLTFLDIEMPRIGGLSVLQNLVEEDPPAAIVMYSSYSSEAILKKTIGLGAKGFITKPFTAEKLLGTAKRALPARG